MAKKKAAANASPVLKSGLDLSITSDALINVMMQEQVKKTELEMVALNEEANKLGLEVKELEDKWYDEVIGPIKEQLKPRIFKMMLALSEFLGLDITEADLLVSMEPKSFILGRCHDRFRNNRNKPEKMKLDVAFSGETSSDDKFDSAEYEEFHNINGDLEITQQVDISGLQAAFDTYEKSRKARDRYEELRKSIAGDNLEKLRREASARLTVAQLEANPEIAGKLREAVGLLNSTQLLLN